MSVLFKGIAEPRIKRIFNEVLDNYPELKKHNLILRQREMPKTTMRAQPKMRSFFKTETVYEVELSNNVDLDDVVKIKEVPDDVLKGWFAHELGHVMDYLGRSFFGMIWFGFRYVVSKKFRIRTEHEADKIAIKYGMAEDILRTKRYILEHSGLPEKYKARIKKYYMSAADVKQLFKAEEHAELKMDSVEILKPKL